MLRHSFVLQSVFYIKIVPDLTNSTIAIEDPGISLLQSNFYIKTVPDLTNSTIAIEDPSIGLTAELPVYQLGTIAKSRSSWWIAKSRCMRDKGVDGRNVHEVVLVGRSIRIPGAQAASGVRSTILGPEGPLHGRLDRRIFRAAVGRALHLDVWSG